MGRWEVTREVRWERGHVPWCGSIGRSVTHFLAGITDFKSHDLNSELVSKAVLECTCTNTENKQKNFKVSQQ